MSKTIFKKESLKGRRKNVFIMCVKMIDLKISNKELNKIYQETKKRK